MLRKLPLLAIITTIVLTATYHFGVFSVFLGTEYGVIVAALVILPTGFGLAHYFDTHG